MSEPTTPDTDAAAPAGEPAGDAWTEAVARAEGAESVEVEVVSDEVVVGEDADGDVVVAEEVVSVVEADGEPVAIVDEVVAVVEGADGEETVVEEVTVTPVGDAELLAAEDAAAELVEEALLEEAAEEEAVVAEAEAIVEQAEDAEDEDVDPVEAFREATRTAPGEWYVVHSYAGYENRVKANLESRIASLNMEDYIFQVEVPIEEVTEIKNGVRKQVKRNKFPGYVLVRCDLTDESWGAVRHTPGVTGFVGHGHQPSPLSLDEVVGILAPKPEKKPGAAPEKGTPRVVDFEVGDAVTIIEGAFGTMQATISEINPDTAKVIVMVELFGRETPVELTFGQIEKS